MPNRNYIKGYSFERQITLDWLGKGYYAKRNYGSKPFDGIIMGRGQSIMWEAKSWKKPPTERWLRKKYQWLKEMAERYGCKAVVYSKQGKGKDNYLTYWL